MTATTDGRRARGDASRQKVARCAADVATLHGLDSVSVGRLATATGVSKSGILTVFENREAIQLAAIAEARRVFISEVIAPVWSAGSGSRRLTALVESWAAYVRRRVFPGGCFLVTTSAEYGAQHGAVADAVRRLEREWLDLLAADAEAAGGDGRTVAFQLDAFLSAGSVRYALFEDDEELGLAVGCALDVIGALG
ncbi:TetR/AcrR family transcriptional regulator [Mumia sp. zg.B53]|uniref:TetR/AcrR family transcriptional regulator n=1 Tax=unclassified Mumia TaxID=2621872 RepID=UPI001C6E0A1E|nr:MULTISPECIES: TetR/AcrR family transcriptional regulator [unclassified Mumia]MBW9214478.1 TetR/AcrR family transcriptional regulator [Mumia sp. zg.B53]MDD9349426.1 TetR/AcrR family transcriptional regulator [Mumia sp.]